MVTVPTHPGIPERANDPILRAMYELWSKASKGSGTVESVTDKTAGVPAEYKDAFDPVREATAQGPDTVTSKSFSLGPDFSHLSFEVDTSSLTHGGDLSNRELVGRVVALGKNLIEVAAQAGLHVQLHTSDTETAGHLSIGLKTEKLQEDY